ncbi:MAG TPA: hypothetical protein VMV24_01020 [Candidatus Dormibacteraeota bacterium]|nr:hypothetical protein [Candidatus Dormibacteraeota bacterium]
MTEKLKPTSIEEDSSLALANFLNDGYEGHIPTYAEEQLAYLSLLDSSGTMNDN